MRSDRKSIACGVYNLHATTWQNEKTTEQLRNPGGFWAHSSDLAGPWLSLARAACREQRADTPGAWPCRRQASGTAAQWRCMAEPGCLGNREVPGLPAQPCQPQACSPSTQCPGHLAAWPRGVPRPTKAACALPSSVPPGLALWVVPAGGVTSGSGL